MVSAPVRRSLLLVTQHGPVITNLSARSSLIGLHGHTSLPSPITASFTQANVASIYSLSRPRPASSQVSYISNLTKSRVLPRPTPSPHSRSTASRSLFNSNIRQKNQNATAGGEKGDAGPKTLTPTIAEHQASVERGAKSIKLNLRARLTKEKDDTRKWSSLREVWRLLRIARRETWPLLGAVSLLLISSGVTISVPLTIGKVMSESSRWPLERTRKLTWP